MSNSRLAMFLQRPITRLGASSTTPALVSPKIAQTIKWDEKYRERDSPSLAANREGSARDRITTITFNNFISSSKYSNTTVPRATAKKSEEGREGG